MYVVCIDLCGFLLVFVMFTQVTSCIITQQKHVQAELVAMACRLVRLPLIVEERKLFFSSFLSG